MKNYNIKTKIAFIVDQFYTDILKFLLNLHEEYELILYMDIDLYNNKDIYIEEYPKLEIKPIDLFIDDLVFNVFNCCYVLNYDNICMPKILLNYKNKLLFAAHNQSHALYLSSMNFRWFSLSQLYNPYNWMTPICNVNINDIEMINTQFAKRHNNGNIIKLFTVGNVNVNEIQKLLDLANIVIYIFTLDSSDKPYLQHLTELYPFKVSILDKKSTGEILKYVKEQNIEFMLYSPQSNRYKYEWPGCLTFAYNHNIPLILPDDVTNEYKLKGMINIGDNIISSIQYYYDHIKEQTEDFNAYKKQMYLRNQVVNKNINDISYYIQSEYGPFFGFENDVYVEKIKNGGYNNKSLVEFIVNNVTKEKNIILDIGSYLGVGMLGVLKNVPFANIISAEPQLVFAKLQKETMLYNNVLDRVKIYNNAFGHKCLTNITMSDLWYELDSLSHTRTKVDYDDRTNKRNYGGLNLGMGGEEIDMLTIDALNVNNISVIKIDVEGVEKLVIWGARKTIMEQRPIIMYRKTWKSLTQDIITMLKLSNKIVSFDIDTFLTSVGYDKTKTVKLDDHIVWQV